MRTKTCLKCCYCDDIRDINKTIYCNFYNKSFNDYKYICNNFKGEHKDCQGLHTLGFKCIQCLNLKKVKK